MDEINTSINKWRATQIAENMDETRKNNTKNLDAAREFKLFVEKEAHTQTDVNQQLAKTQDQVDAKKTPPNPFGIPS